MIPDKIKPCIANLKVGDEVEFKDTNIITGTVIYERAIVIAICSDITEKNEYVPVVGMPDTTRILCYFSDAFKIKTSFRYCLPIHKHYTNCSIIKIYKK